MEVVERAERLQRRGGLKEAKHDAHERQRHELPHETQVRGEKRIENHGIGRLVGHW